MTTATSEFTSEAGTASSQFTEKASQLRSLLQEMAGLVPSAAGEQFQNLRNSASDFLVSARDGAGSVGRKAYAKAKEHPAQTALYAIGAAALTWWLLSRRGGESQDYE